MHFTLESTERGEDIERLLLWFGSVSEHNGASGLCVGAVRYWRETLNNWADGTASGPTRTPAYDDLLRSYRQDVLLPLSPLWDRCKASQARFMSGPDARSDWDNYLWDIYFGRVVIDASIFVYPAIEEAWLRRWWRIHGSRLTAEEKDILYQAHVETTQAHGDLEVLDWSDIIPIDDALDLANIPDFDRCKRDW